MATPAGRQPQQLSVDFAALRYIRNLVEAFQAFDSDNDGLVTAPELRGLWRPSAKSESEARDMLARPDADRDGRLSVEELLDVMNTGELGMGALLQSAEGPDGVLGADELTRVLSFMGTASAEDGMAIIACMDGDGDVAILGA